MLNLCFAVWCAVGSSGLNATYPPPFSLTIGQEAVSKAELTERLVILEQYNAFVGLVTSEHTLTPIVGYQPLNIRWWRARLAGGAVLSTAPVPVRGTSANWTARLRLQVAGPLWIEWFHLSNARSAVPNPSLDALALRFSW